MEGSHIGANDDRKEIKTNTREVALDILSEVFDKDAYVNKTVEAHLRRYPGMSRADRAFVTRLSTGTTERKITLDYVIGLYADVPVNKQKPLIRTVLRMTAYQLLYMDVSDYAACDEAVKLVRKRGKGALSGFVNAIARKMAKNKEEVLSSIENLEAGQGMDEVRALSVKYSVPEFLCELFLENFGNEDTKRAFAYFLDENRTSIRCNLSRTTPEELKESLEKDGAFVEPGRCLKTCFKIEGYDTLPALSAFASGKCQVQDESSALVGTIAGIRPGNTVLDICAAPGGKTIHAADLLKYEESSRARKEDTAETEGSAGSDEESAGVVISCDISERKLSLIRENILRCGFDNIDVMVNDAEEYREEFFECADVVLADLPCSGLGIIAKKPDIKYRTDREGIEALSALQKRMLINASRYVKPGGTLIFSTCTLTKEEDEENADFIVKETGLVPVSLDDCLPECLRSADTARGVLKLIPGKYGTDGFFISKFRKL
ncbi:MAG: 16S rRNA (cytosine(967)-C(5))-methyltransferase RsmB [Lachnospiraceae bacterium]|nr:16S rRNA (cytosine(967)-C(5))-methyltransferase RsmB [Lachnospiraceae bacterium]